MYKLQQGVEAGHGFVALLKKLSESMARTVDVVSPRCGVHDADITRKKDSVEESGFGAHDAVREECLEPMTTEPENEKLLTSVTGHVSSGPLSISHRSVHCSTEDHCLNCIMHVVS